MSVTIESDLKEILTKIDQKLDTLSRGIFIGLIVAILGGFAKLFGFVGVQ